MADSCSVETDAELELYEEIVGNLSYTTPVASKPYRPISYSEDRTTATTFKGPIITNTSESTVISASAAIVDPVTLPDPRSSCSLAGRNQVPRPLAQRSDGISATAQGHKVKYSNRNNRRGLCCKNPARALRKRPWHLIIAGYRAWISHIGPRDGIDDSSRGTSYCALAGICNDGFFESSGGCPILRIRKRPRRCLRYWCSIV